MTPHRFIAFSAVMAAFAFWIGIIPASAATAERSSAEIPASMQAKDDRQSQPAGIECKGMLKAFREVKLASRAKGVLCEIKKEGSFVKEGEAVFKLEDNLERLQLIQQEHVVKVRDFENQAGVKLQHIISKEEAMEKTANFEVSKIQRDQAQELLRRRTVYAPFDGVVTDKMREAGEAVDEFMPVLVMVDLSKLYFEAFIPAARVGDVLEGQRVEIHLDTYPDKNFQGIVEFKSPVINPASGEFKIKILIENKDGVLHSGLIGTAVIFPQETPVSVTASQPR